MNVKSVPTSTSERHCDRNGHRGQQITGKLKERHTEPFRAVLLDVMNSTTRFDNINERGDIYGKKIKS